MRFMGLSSSKLKQALYRQLVYYFPAIVRLWISFAKTMPGVDSQRGIE